MLVHIPLYLGLRSKIWEFFFFFWIHPRRSPCHLLPSQLRRQLQPKWLREPATWPKWPATWPVATLAPASVGRLVDEFAACAMQTEVDKHRKNRFFSTFLSFHCSGWFGAAAFMRIPWFAMPGWLAGWRVGWLARGQQRELTLTTFPGCNPIFVAQFMILQRRRIELLRVKEQLFSVHALQKDRCSEQNNTLMQRWHYELVKWQPILLYCACRKICYIAVVYSISHWWLANFIPALHTHEIVTQMLA
jgi:hypothetical protein